MKTAMDTIKKQVRNSASKMLEHLKNMEQMQTRKQLHLAKAKAAGDLVECWQNLQVKHILIESR